MATDADTIEAWTVRSCIDVAGNHTCWDICLPSLPSDRGVGVVASVFGDKQTAELIAAAPKMYAALAAFEKQWSACGGNSQFGGLFQTVRDAAVEALAEADAAHWANRAKQASA